MYRREEKVCIESVGGSEEPKFINFVSLREVPLVTGLHMKSTASQVMSMRVNM